MTDLDGISAGLAARLALERHGFHPSHSLGQNFILDDELIQRIVDAAQVKAGDRVLEIGPGPGVMTRHLIDAGADVTTVELDEGLKPVLSDVLGERTYRLIFGDALKLDIAALMGDAPYSVVANLPYYITTDVVLRLLGLPNRPTAITIMVQKEAAERMMSGIGSKSWCALSAIVQYYGKVERLLTLPPEAFNPPPHVDSALIRISVHADKPVSARDDSALIKLINAAFAMRRKTLVNNLTSAYGVSKDKAVAWLKSMEIDERVRGEALTIEQLCRLSDTIDGDRAD